MTRMTCNCKDCKARSAVNVPATFAPALPRTKALAHGLVFQANHPTLGAGFRAQTGITLG